MVRAPAVAGRFYPADKKGLLRDLHRMLSNAPKTKSTPQAIMVPHAGYMYSGAIAGEAYARIDVPRRVIILNPNHTGRGARISVSDFDGWETPIGVAPVDAEIREVFLHHCPSAKLDQQAHLSEHAAEVHIPFLQRLQPDVNVLPITLGGLSVKECRTVGEALAASIRAAGGSAAILIVASSDMNHYEPADVSRAKDQRALDRILALDAVGLFNVVEAEQISMCGVLPATSAIFAAKALGATRAELVRYANSGDVSGDYDAVVGYASVLIT